MTHPSIINDRAIRLARSLRGYPCFDDFITHWGIITEDLTLPESDKIFELESMLDYWELRAKRVKGQWRDNADRLKEIAEIESQQVEPKEKPAPVEKTETAKPVEKPRTVEQTKVVKKEKPKPQRFTVTLDELFPGGPLPYCRCFAEPIERSFTGRSIVEKALQPLSVPMRGGDSAWWNANNRFGRMPVLTMKRIEAAQRLY